MLCYFIRTLTRLCYSFWSYELCQRWFARQYEMPERSPIEVLISGGVAGVVTWASIYPLDVIKTVLQSQSWSSESESLLAGPRRPLNSLEVARQIYRSDGLGAFYRGFGVCSIRAFIVNAVQWYTYEKIMELLQQKP